MQKHEAAKIARTYRLDEWVVDKLKAFRADMKMRPSETSIVQAAIIEFIERESGEAKRSARR